jgi:hypothetical protein
MFARFSYQYSSVIYFVRFVVNIFNGSVIYLDVKIEIHSKCESGNSVRVLSAEFDMAKLMLYY